jgi:hypothetical protein
METIKIYGLTTVCVLVAVVLGSLVLGACSQDQKGLGDSGVGQKLESKRDVIIMPDQFANVAMACDGHGHRVYVTTRPAAPVVIDDPTCK